MGVVIHNEVITYTNDEQYTCRYWIESVTFNCYTNEVDKVHEVMTRMKPMTDLM